LLHKAWEHSINSLEPQQQQNAFVSEPNYATNNFNGQLQSNSNAFNPPANNYFQNTFGGSKINGMLVTNTYGDNRGPVNGTPVSNNVSGGLFDQLQKQFQSNAPYHDRFSELFGNEIRNANAPAPVNVPFASVSKNSPAESAAASDKPSKKKRQQKKKLVDLIIDDDTESRAVPYYWVSFFGTYHIHSLLF
jgi:hypothetical protein